MLPVSNPLNLSDDEFFLLQQNAWDIVNNDADYPKKIRSKNFYKKLSPILLEKAEAILSSYTERGSLNWYFEIFHSMEPVHMHNDRNYFSHMNERCDRGLIIPLAWSGPTPTTRFYDLYFEEKVNWNGDGNFKTLKGEILPYAKESLQKRMALEWGKKEILFFDSRQIHDAGIFQESSSDFKLSINALGYSKYP